MDSLYLITNGKNFLRVDSNGSFMATKSKEQAKKFPYKSAANAMNNLPKSLKNLGYHLEEFSFKDAKEFELIPVVKNDKVEEKSISEILSEVEKFETYLKNIGSTRTALASELSKVDSEIEDILHAIEFYQLNVCEGYKMYKMLRERRIKRRKLKDYIEVVGYIEGFTGKRLANGEGSKSIKGKLERDYAPRALPELFNR